MKNSYQNLTPFTGFNPLNHTQIWLATDSILQKSVLIKQLKQGFNSLQFKQFYQEYQVYQKLATLADLEKIHFANWLDFYQHNGDYFLVLDYYKDKTLKQIITEKQLNFSEKVALLIKLCQAIEVLHSLEVVHCDIKPSNILIIKNQVKLLDFGLSKNIGENLISDNFTAGTPAYMSPEQFTGEQMTYQSDYYSLGVVMYELLVGEKLFIANSLEQWVICHCQQPVPTITAFPPIQNQIINHILSLLLAKFPANRPANLTQIRLLLKNLLKK